MRRFALGELPSLLSSPLGRRELVDSAFQTSFPLLAPLARAYRRLLRGTRVVAVVGSFGKTTTTRAVAHVVGAPLGRLARRNGYSFVAGQLLTTAPWRRCAVLEVGIDRPGIMAIYARVVRPDITVVTSIGSEHHTSLGTLETTRHEKSRMVAALAPSGLAVLNADDPQVRAMRSATRARIVTFGLTAGAEIRATDLELRWPTGLSFELRTPAGDRRVQSRLIGEHQVHALLAATAVALELGDDLDQVVSRVEDLAPTPGRLQPVELPSGAWLLRDDFKSTLETYEAALATLGQIEASRRIAVLGAISEVPAPSRLAYAALGQKLAHAADLAIVIGKTERRRFGAGARAAGMPSAALLRARDVADAARLLANQAPAPGDVVLIKGRRHQRLERIPAALLGRDVRCRLKRCRTMLNDCEDCVMLERGWRDREQL